MIVAVRRIGNELVVVLPGDVAARLNARDGVTLAVTETEGGYLIAPAETARADAVPPETLDLIDEIIERYDETLKILAR